jgi:hypothetical protein
MGLRNSKPKHLKDKKIEKSVRNKHGQQMNEFTEQKSKIRHSTKKPGKKNSEVGFQTKKYKTKSKINGSAQETDESDTDYIDPSNQILKYSTSSRPFIADNNCVSKKINISAEYIERSLPPYKCSSSDNYEEQISRMDKIRAQGTPYVPRRRPPAPPPPDVLD